MISSRTMSKLDNTTERSRKRRKLSPPAEVQKVAKSNKDVTKVNESPVPTALPSVKDLASSESSVRRAALKTILSHLKERPAGSSLSATECLQLWKGFFVAIYMHDSKNAISVQNLLKEIANTFQIFDEKERELYEHGVAGASTWLEQYHVAFWQTLVKEWAGIDSHRMNKYLLLVRFVTRELATICLRPSFQAAVQDSGAATNGKTRKRKAKPDSDKEKHDLIQGARPDKVQSVTKVLKNDGPLNTKDRKIPDGLRLHVLDLYVTEISSGYSTLAEENADGAQKPDFATVQEIFTGLKSPVLEMSHSDSGSPRNIRLKAKEALEEFGTKEEEMQESS